MTGRRSPFRPALHVAVGESGVWVADWKEAATGVVQSSARGRVGGMPARLPDTPADIREAQSYPDLKASAAAADASPCIAQDGDTLPRPLNGSGRGLPRIGDAGRLRSSR